MGVQKDGGHRSLLDGQSVALQQGNCQDVLQWTEGRPELWHVDWDRLLPPAPVEGVYHSVRPPTHVNIESDADDIDLYSFD